MDDNNNNTNNENPVSLDDDNSRRVWLNVPRGFERIEPPGVNGDDEYLPVHAVNAVDFMHPFADYLPLYREAGWRPLLFPPRKKFPPPVGFTGRYEAELSAEQWEAQLETWARQYGGKGNIALRVPANVIALDVDAYHGGLETLAELERAFGALPKTWRNVNRDDGSGHYFLRLPDGFEGSKFRGVAGPGIEVVQHTHRYAVAPGSIHPSGLVYHWISPETNREEWLHFPKGDGSDFAELPVAWAEALRARGAGGAGDVLTRGDAVDVLARDETVVVSAWISQHGSGDPTPQVESALQRGLEGLQEPGGRYDAMCGATFNLTSYAMEGESGVSGALDELHAAYVAAIEAEPRAGLSPADGARVAEREWDRQVTGAVQIAAHRLTTNLSVPADDDPDVAKELRRLRVSNRARQLLAADDAARLELPLVVNLRGLLDAPDEEIIYRVNKLWPTGGRIMLAAAYKAGKTTIVANLLRSLVDGTPFLGAFDVQQVERVVLIDDELDIRTIRRWLRDQGIVNVDRVSVVSLRGIISSFDILSPEGRRRWAAHLGPVGDGVVLLDCLRPILDALNLSEDHDAGKFLTAFDEFLGMIGAPEAVVVHHMGHTGERTRGDSRLRVWPDATWTLTRADPNDDRSQRHMSAYGRDVDVPEGALSFDPASRHLSFEAGGSRIQVRVESLAEAVTEYVQTHPKCSQTVLEKGVGARAHDVREAAADLADRGLIRREKVGNAWIHSPVESPSPAEGGE